MAAGLGGGLEGPASTLPLAARRRARLDGIIELARRYRGWTRTNLAERLGRDPGKLVPESGVPRLDLVASLARMLDWPIGDLAESIWIDGPEMDAICDRPEPSPEPSPEPNPEPSPESGPEPVSQPESKGASSAASPDREPLPIPSAIPPAIPRAVATAGARAIPTEPPPAIRIATPAGERAPFGPTDARHRERSSPSAPQSSDLRSARAPMVARVPASFAELDLRACNAHRRGDPGDLYRIAEAMATVAHSADERAIAANREAGAWDLRGRYGESIRAIRRGLEEQSLRDDIRLTLEANLANAHYALWHLVEAHAISTRLIDRFRHAPPRTRLERVIAAFARYVRGNATRRGIAEASAFELGLGRGPEAGDAAARVDGPIDLADRSRASAADRAVHDLERALEDYRRLHEEFGDPSYDAIASTCRGGIVECRVELGDMAAGEAMEIVLDLLADVADVATLPADDRLESFGWWAIFGCNIALRHLDGPFFHRAMAICTNKAAEIAERLDHWGIRERVFTIEHVQQRRRSASIQSTAMTGRAPREGAIEQPSASDAPVWLLDTDDLRILAGTMGRFPGFRETGWRILSSARLSDED